MMERFRYQALAGPRFAADEDVSVGWSDEANRVVELRHEPRSADQAA